MHGIIMHGLHLAPSAPAVQILPLLAGVQFFVGRDLMPVDTRQGLVYQVVSCNLVKMAPGQDAANLAKTLPTLLR